MLLSSVVTASLYDRREVWLTEARDMNGRRIVEPVSLKQEATDEDLERTV
jgi:hypothetical protein